MQFSCTQENFRTALALTGHIAARQGSLPILSNVLIRAEQRALAIVTTNLEIGMTYQLRGKVEHDGVFTANARLLADVVQLLPRDRVDATVQGNELILTCGGAQTKVRGMDASEFPLIPTVDRAVEARLRTDVFRAALGQVAFAVATSEGRPELSGVLARFNEHALTLAATDSYRLAEVRLPVASGNIPSGTSFIIPGRTVGEFLRILGQAQDEVEDLPDIALAPTASQLLATVGNLAVVSRLIDGTYPDYTPILPQSWTTRAVLARPALQAAAKAATLFSRTGIHDVHLRLLPPGQVVARAENAQLGEHQAAMDAEVRGDEVKVILNGRYLLDGIAAIPTDRVAVEVTTASAPVVLRPVGGEGDDAAMSGYLYVIMPIKQ